MSAVGTQFRATPRYTLEHRVTVRIGDALEREAVLENVGFGGARLLLPDAPSLGTVVRIRISTATAWEPITIDGIVRWCDDEDSEPARVGLELAPLAPSTALALDAWLATLGYDAAPARR